ncbi:lipopolysaccharide biosynthesis protein [Moritella viscosa]|uniref:Transporter of NadC family protein n=1 Tax=Moritella viscosa TaxID=80854 RepID=A0A090ICL6_9GAMM|nr:MATE family efflux transporter [Moritella viscosa]CED59920.1 membrane protein [Moritella viscosa]SGY87538.1 Transporter of NadC family protein [Moritella viscosa]SGY90658.1 Transporter of NadC family protein [Moritella viscosa]SGY90689.1 Transporter of NadC family protein [Moritella viscosa]SGY93327.1 Transporter of NadC family protein [Moritella viscosa]
METNSGAPRKEDLTGQDRFAWNLLVSWSSQLVLVFSGFIMPRLVDDKVGQVALGVWDFGWSFVSYLTLVGLGMGACFNRYIAKHRSAGEFVLLNKVANSAVFVQVIFSLITVLCTVLFYVLLPHYFSDALKENTTTAQWVVLFLGFSVAVRMLTGSACGLLTGYHRWDIHNALHAGDSILSLILMVSALHLTELGVVGMALGYLISTTVFEVLRFISVGKVCKEFHFDLRMVNWSTCLEMLIFGIKSMLSNIPPLILLQTISIMLVSVTGPAALAVFARSMALTKQISTFMTKFTLMLTPTTGSMLGTGDIKEIKYLFINTTALSFAFTLPSLGFLFIYGDVILQYWMGNEYAQWPLIMILAAGQLLPMGQDTSIRILMGMNRHGVISIAACIAVFVIFVIGLLWTGLDNWELTTAAILFVVPMNIVYGFIIPVYTCRQLKLPWLNYVYCSFIKPVIYATPFLGFIFWSRQAFDSDDNSTALVTFLFASIVTSIIYFIFLVPKNMQHKIISCCKF